MKSLINPIKKLDFYLDDAGGGVPIESSCYLRSFNFYYICFKISGKDRRIASTNNSESLFVNDFVPKTL